MPQPILQRKERIDGLYSLLLEKKEISVAKVKDAIRQKWGLTERVINEYIKCLGAKPKIMVKDGVFKVRE